MEHSIGKFKSECTIENNTDFGGKQLRDWLLYENDKLNHRTARNFPGRTRERASKSPHEPQRLASKYPCN